MNEQEFYHGGNCYSEFILLFNNCLMEGEEGRKDKPFVKVLNREFASQQQNQVEAKKF